MDLWVLAVAPDGGGAKGCCSPGALEQLDAMVDAVQNERANFGEERRYLALLFADLSDSTALSDLMEQEHYGALIAQVRTVYEDTIGRYGGVVERVHGDGVLASFGFSGAEDAGRQAVQAALELHDRVRSLPVALPGGFKLALHSGIHSGLVLLREGGTTLGKHELFGPVPNIAARLASCAGPHELLVSEESLGPARRFFVTSPPALLGVKGRAAPVLVYKVDARASSSEAVRAAYRSGTAFLGRASELELLDSELAAVMAGNSRALAIVGPAGQGKTRLAEQFLGHAQQHGCAVLRGYCDSTGAAPCQPFLHMLQALGREHAPPSEIEWSLALTARERPLVLFIDDWQWADDASHVLLSALRARTDCLLLVILCTRPEGALTLPVDRTLALPPLEAAEALQLIMPGRERQPSVPGGAVPLRAARRDRTAAQPLRGQCSLDRPAGAVPGAGARPHRARVRPGRRCHRQRRSRVAARAPYRTPHRRCCVGQADAARPALHG